ncbi:hypothetical protein ACQEXU_08345 [Vibrio sp. TRT 21S02]
MEKIINTIGLAILTAKYTSILLLAGITFSTGAIAAESLILLGGEPAE